MTHTPRHRCGRCGGDVYNPGSYCNDCRQVDPIYCRKEAS